MTLQIILHPLQGSVDASVANLEKFDDALHHKSKMPKTKGSSQELTLNKLFGIQVHLIEQLRLICANVNCVLIKPDIPGVHCNIQQLKSRNKKQKMRN